MYVRVTSLFTFVCNRRRIYVIGTDKNCRDARVYVKPNDLCLSFVLEFICRSQVSNESDGHVVYIILTKIEQTGPGEHTSGGHGIDGVQNSFKFEMCLLKCDQDTFIISPFQKRLN